MSSQSFSSFNEFYPYYLQEHANATCRLLHFIGSSLILCLMGFVFVTAQFTYLFALPVIGYGFAWIGHFFFEHNRPATFKHPLYSLMGDWVMFKDILIGKVSLSNKAIVDKK